jgi:hypothetical protein
MPLTNKAVLFVDTGNYFAEFHVEQNFEYRPELNKQYLLGGNSGQLPSELLDTVGIGDGANAVGYNIDLGLGTDAVTLSAELGPTQNNPWGLVSEPGGVAIIDEDDAKSAHDGDALERAEVLKQNLRTIRTGSLRDRISLYIGEWSDGTYASSAGKFGEPIRVAVESVEISKESDAPSTAEVTVTLLRTKPFKADIGDILPDL